MDGLTVGRIDSTIGLDEITKSKTSNVPKINPAPTQGASFADALKQAVSDTNQLQQVADKKMQELATGKSQNIHETMLAVEKADVSLRLMLQVRNKIIDAYHEVMKMQV
jgi:flagellar hook-basal body complex protein FliE